MATREGVDFSGPRPSAEALRAAGRDFVLRYARKTGSLDKQITAVEAAYWQAHGVDIGIIEESHAARALDGYDAGRYDAARAREAVQAVGGPADGGVIYMAVDFDASAVEAAQEAATDVAQLAAVAADVAYAEHTAAQMPDVLAYLRGAATVLGQGRTGVYGSYWACQAVQVSGACKYLWQTYAWSAGRVLPGIHLYQYRNAQTLGGVAVDYCRTSVADWGQWAWKAPPRQETFMTLTDAQELEILARVRDTHENTVAIRAQFDPAAAGSLIDKLNRTGVRLSEVQAAVSLQADDEQRILGRLDALDITLTDAQVEALALALGINADAVAEAVRTNLAAALGTL